MVERVSTLLTHQRSVNDIIRLQADLAQLQKQISSGREITNFSELGPGITRVLDLQASSSSLDRYVEGNETVISRLQISDLAVSKAEDIARTLAQNLVLKRSSSGEALDITSQINTALDSLAGLLNTVQGGRYVFSGTKTDQAPVSAAFLKSETNIVEGEVTANYYQGDDYTFSVNAGDQVELEYGVKANDSAFQNLIGALNKALEGQEDGNNDDHYTAAVNLVNTAVEELARLRGKINTNLTTLRETNVQHGRVKDELQKTLNDQVGTDVVEASIKVALNEATLTATMQVFAQISRLSLIDFLR